MPLIFPKRGVCGSAQRERLQILLFLSFCRRANSFHTASGLSRRSGLGRRLELSTQTSRSAGASAPRCAVWKPDVCQWCSIGQDWMAAPRFRTDLDTKELEEWRRLKAPMRRDAASTTRYSPLLIVLLMIVLLSQDSTGFRLCRASLDTLFNPVSLQSSTRRETLFQVARAKLDGIR